MRAYADTLLQAMSRHSPDIEIDMVELDPQPASGSWSRRLRTLALPLLASRRRSLSPDVWHVLDASRAHLALRLGDRPVMATVHDIIPWLQDEGRFPGVPRLGWAARQWWNGNARALRSAASVLCVSANTARDAQRAFAIEPELCRVVPLPLNVPMSQRLGQASASRRDDATLLHVGNNGFYKNREGVLRVFSRIASQLPSARLLMAGPAPTPELSSLASELGIADRIQWRIDANDDELARCYRSASVLLFPSLYEGFGWPVLEAMAFGLPVVASDAGSLPEVVGDAAPCFPPEDEAGMAEAVLRMMTAPDVHAGAIRRGLARAAEFGEAAFAARMRQAYFAAAGRTETQGR